MGFRFFSRRFSFLRRIVGMHSNPHFCKGEFSTSSLKEWYLFAATIRFSD
jgi:hypothetical protein